MDILKSAFGGESDSASEDMVFAGDYRLSSAVVGSVWFLLRRMMTVLFEMFNGN